MKINLLFVLSFLVGVTVAINSHSNLRLEEQYNFAVKDGKKPEAFMKELAGELDSAAELYEIIIRESGGTDKLAFYNLGNVYLKMAFADSGAKFIENAIEYYKSALRIDPGFMEAKHNLEIALRLLRSIQIKAGQNQKEDGGDNGKDKGKSGSHTPFKSSDI